MAAGGGESVFDAFVAAAAEVPDRLFVIAPASATRLYEPAGVTLTYRDAATAVALLRRSYARAGYGPGLRVALMLENRPAFLLHWLALNALQVSVVPLNPALRAQELAYLLEHSEAAAVVTVPERAESVFAAIVAANLEFPVGIAGEAFEPPLPHKAEAGASVPPAADEGAVLYTSGTTAKPKGCILGNDYFLAAGRWYAAEGGLCTLRAGADRVLTPLPFFHMNALAFSFQAVVETRNCLVMIDRFHPATWWADVAKTQATAIHYLGVMPAILLGHPPAPTDRAHRVRFGFGAGVDPKHHAAFEKRFGFPLIEAWAMTETGAGACVAASREPRRVGTRCFGKPAPTLAYRIVGDDGGEAAPGTPGEFYVRNAGPEPRAGFFAGYLKDPAATTAAWADGWFHTGDVVRAVEGALHFVERKKNVIRRSGENIAALEVEGVLVEHAAVREAAVIAVQDATRGEEVMACVVLKTGLDPSEATARAIADFCRERLAYFKAPGWVLFRDALPTTATQKVEKAKLKVPLAELLHSPTCFDLRALKKPPVQH
ncbi:MAG: ATP-dependent acyl-CoA ligase [Alphaproteobacteria bacterium]|nr:ATP-dependent acyl-CoA ligase [Alphaproteobacteria bacterium]